MKTLLLAIILALNSAAAIAQDTAIRDLGDGFQTKSRPQGDREVVLVKFPDKYLTGDFLSKPFIEGTKIAVERAGDCKEPVLSNARDTHDVAVFRAECSNGPVLLVYPLYASEESSKLFGVAFLKYRGD